MVEQRELEHRFRDAVHSLGFEFVDDSVQGPPALEDLLADIDQDADAPIRALTLLCGRGDGDVVALTKLLLDLGEGPENAAWAARLWTDTRDSGPAAEVDEPLDPLTDPEPVLDLRQPLPEPERQVMIPSGTVALLFTDIEGSTKRWVDDADRMHVAVRRHDAVLRDHIETHGGYIFTTAGDAFCAAFSDVHLAVTAAVASQVGLADVDFADVGGLPVRMAVHVGAVEERDGDYFGTELSRVARILGYTSGGQITLSAAAAAQLPAERCRLLGEVSLRDLDELETVHEVVDEALRSDLPALRIPVLPTTIPSPPTSFIGRTEIVATLARLVREHRLVTMLGTGGLGKTRIAIEVSERESIRRPVVFAELAPATDRAALEIRVLSDLAIDVDGAGTTVDLICDAIGDDELLLVLDNCEQVVLAAADFVEDVLAHCPAVTVLATSRELLEVSGERIVRVGGLHESDLGDAVELFIARASEAGVDTESFDRKTVEDICVRLDGLPLAIELAAAKTVMLPLAEIQSGLGNRLDLLKQRGRRQTGRHSSLRTMLDWSWELLDDELRSSLAQLAAFAGGFGIEEAALILNHNQVRTLATLEDLLSRSLIVRDADPGVARFRLLHSALEYATEKAEELGVRSSSRVRHLAWVADVVQAAGVDFSGGSTAAEAMTRLDRAQHEIAIALDFASRGGDVTTGLQMTITLWDWWRGRLQLVEGVDRIERLLAVATDDTFGDVIVGSMVIRAEFMRMLHGPVNAVSEAIKEARARIESVSDTVLANRYRLRLALAEFDDSDEDIEAELWSLVEAARAAGTTEDTMGLHLLTAWSQPRDAGRSLELARETLATAERHGNAVAAAHARELCAIALTDLGRTGDAAVELIDAIHELRQASQPACLLHCAESVAWYLHQRGDVPGATDLYSAAVGLRHRLRRQRAGFEVHAARQVAAKDDVVVAPNDSVDIDEVVAMMTTALSQN